MMVVLIRHAQKDFLPFDDPALNEKGFQQAEELCVIAKKNILPTNTPPATLELWCSDRTRTRQTLEKLAAEYKVKPEIHSELNLRETHEQGKDFRLRLEKLVTELTLKATSSAPKSIFLCTHFDVIEELMTLIPSDTDLSQTLFMHWAPTQYMVFEIKNKTWHLIKMGTASNV